MPRVIDNPRSGERMVIRQSASDTNGELLVFDLYLRPGAHVPAGHSHPFQRERFTVVAGDVRFRLGTRQIDAAPGTTVEVPCGTPHWFGNRGPRDAQVRVEVRPALRTEELLATMAERAVTGGRRWWRRLVDTALLPLDFQPEVGVPYVSARVVTAVLTPLTWLRAAR